jgi:hypothetical protein
MFHDNAIGASDYELTISQSGDSKGGAHLYYRGSEGALTSLSPNGGSKQLYQLSASNYGSFPKQSDQSSKELGGSGPISTGQAFGTNNSGPTLLKPNQTNNY